MSKQIWEKNTNFIFDLTINLIKLEYCSKKMGYRKPFQIRAYPAQNIWQTGKLGRQD